MSEEGVFDGGVELREFLFLCLGLGLNNLQSEGSLVPMIVTVRNNQFSLCALAVDSHQVMNAAANHLSGLPDEAERYALVFSGKIGVGSQLVHAVIVQGGECGGTTEYILFQPYAPKTFATLGDPQYGGHADQLLRR